MHTDASTISVQSCNLNSNHHSAISEIVLGADACAIIKFIGKVYSAIEKSRLTALHIFSKMSIGNSLFQFNDIVSMLRH